MKDHERLNQGQWARGKKLKRKITVLVNNDCHPDWIERT